MNEQTPLKPSRFSLDFPRAQGPLSATAVFRQVPEDFKVDEELGFEPAGEGEHLYLHIRKRGENTDWLAGRIAKFAGTEKKDVSFAGLKDRHAETSQWFSVYAPKGPELEWRHLAAQAGADIDLLRATRHTHKLRRGQHARNHFSIRVRELVLEDSGTLDQLALKLEFIKRDGVPNYFGEQRFGRNATNLNLAADWLEQGVRIRDRRLRGMVMSAARSWLFSQVLAARVASGDWHRVVEGDICDDSGTPTGPLWGRGRSATAGKAAAYEEQSLGVWGQWRDGLEHCGLNQERRPFVCRPAAMEWSLDDGDLTVNFALAPGQFATAVLREIAKLHEVRPTA